MEQTLKEFVSFYSLYVEKGPSAKLRDVSSIFEGLIRDKPVSVITSPPKTKQLSQPKLDRNNTMKIKSVYKKNYSTCPTFTRGYNTWLLKPDDYNRGKKDKLP